MTGQMKSSKEKDAMVQEYIAKKSNDFARHIQFFLLRGSSVYDIIYSKIPKDYDKFRVEAF